MNKEQLYDVFIEFKDGYEEVSLRNRRTLDVKVMGNALVLNLWHKNGIGTLIHNLDTILSCSVTPLSDEENEKQWKELEANE